MKWIAANCKLEHRKPLPETYEGNLGSEQEQRQHLLPPRAWGREKRQGIREAGSDCTSETNSTRNG